MADPNDGWQDVPEEEWVEAHEATGEPGQPGHDPYAGGPNARVDNSPTRLRGTPLDAVKTFANKAALSAGPQIAGAMGAVMHSATNPMQRGTSDLDAYRSVRDDTARELQDSENTQWGEAVAPLGVIATPVPVKALPMGATGGARAAQGAKVGGGAGFIHGAATSSGDLTKMDGANWGQVLKDALVSGGAGAGGGAIAGPMLGGAERGLRSTAETQALRAAGMRGGISNQVQKQLGLSNMTEARQLGRQFLDEGLIPLAGSSERVGKNAEKLMGVAGNAKGSTLAQAQASGKPFDYAAMAKAVKDPIADPLVTTALERNRAGSKAASYADDIAEQGLATPGNWKMADQTKSKAWQTANFEADPKLAPKMYRQAVGRSAGDIERQIGDALGPQAQKTFSEANRRYGVGADALKLADNASTRDAQKKAFGMPEILAMTTGAGAAGGHAMGHGVEGALGGLAIALGAKGFDKYGHSSAARFSDFLAKRAANNSGGVVGGRAGEAVKDFGLKKYMELLEEEQ
jgi:hypothetical protein